jgi:ABC-type transporter Mla subunit MlaD
VAEDRGRTEGRTGRGRPGLVVCVCASAVAGTALWAAGVAGGRVAGLGRAEEVVELHSSAGIRKKMSKNRKQIIMENIDITL